jgi:CxxC motif-containing protein
MNKTLICIECPVGCALSVDYDGGVVSKVAGNNCSKGLAYAASEIQNPSRILTSSVLCVGLDLRMLPVRTDRPIPKSRLQDAMCEVKNIRWDRPVRAGEEIVTDFMGLGISLISCRDAA